TRGLRRTQPWWRGPDFRVAALEPGSSGEPDDEEADDAQGVEMEDERTERDAEGDQIDDERSERGGDRRREEFPGRAFGHETDSEFRQEGTENEPGEQEHAEAAGPPSERSVHRRLRS